MWGSPPVKEFSETEKKVRAGGMGLPMGPVRELLNKLRYCAGDGGEAGRVEGLVERSHDSSK